MKTLFICLLLCALPIPTNAQSSAGISVTPASKIIDAAQLLRDVQILSADDMEGRATDSPGGTKAREYVIQKFKSAHLAAIKYSVSDQDRQDSYIQKFEFQSRRSHRKTVGANIIGSIVGTLHPEKYIIITAHYDHLGIRNGKIYNGADDNASGASALFAIANYFEKHRPENSLLFVAFDAEEIGLQGSKYFVAHLPIDKAAILLEINMDMISHNEKNQLYAVGTHSYPFLKSYIKTVQKQAPIHLLIGHDTPNLGKDDWTSQSDQWPFHQAKIPFIYFGVEDHKDYHHSTDDFVNINPTFYIHAVETIVSTIELMDEKIITPSR